jgi:Flp pilus assembly pilin Flp
MATDPESRIRLRETIRITPCGEETSMDLILKFAYDDAGAPALEYALILALLGVGLISGISALGGTLSNVFASLRF